MTNLTRVRNTIEMLDGLIENLTKDRETKTLALETLARQYYNLYSAQLNAGKRRPILCCTSGYFEFDSFEDESVYFSLRCPLDGDDDGIHVSNAWLDNMMKEDGDASQG